MDALARDGDTEGDREKAISELLLGSRWVWDEQPSLVDMYACGNNALSIFPQKFVSSQRGAILHTAMWGTRQSPELLHSCFFWKGDVQDRACVALKCSMLCQAFK